MGLQGHLSRGQLWLATWFGAGQLPWFPGTWGSLGALPLWLGLQFLPLKSYLVVLLVIFLVAVWVSGAGASHFGRPDPGEVVIDEVVGQLLALSACPFRLGPIIIGFLLFRLFDILKPFPARFFDRKLVGGLGIVLDDVVAGLYAGVVLQGLMFLGWL